MDISLKKDGRRYDLYFGVCLIILGKVWYLIVSFPDLCTLTYFEGSLELFRTK